MKKTVDDSSKLRIAMMGHKHFNSREGGVEIVVSELAKRMTALGCQVTCFDRISKQGKKADEDSTALERNYGVEVVPVWTIDRKGLAAMTASFSAAIRAAWGQYDVVHIHAEGPAAMTLLPKAHGKRTIVTIHGLDWAREKWGGFATKYIKWGEKQAVKYADEIIVLSRGIQDYFWEKYGRETIFIPNGVNRPTYRAANEIEKRWGLKKDSYFLFLGRIVPEKGLRYLIEAWQHVHTEKKLVIAGGSSDTDSFLLEIKSMAGDNVIFTGFQQGIILEELYSNAYVYTLPSDLEGMPLSLLEAMSYGNCCLVSDISECAEVVEEKAVLFKHSDVKDLIAKLQQLADDYETVMSFKSSSADYICKKYNWDDVVRKTLRLYMSNKENQSGL